MKLEDIHIKIQSKIEFDKQVRYQNEINEKKSQLIIFKKLLAYRERGASSSGYNRIKKYDNNTNNTNNTFWSDQGSWDDNSIWVD